MAGEASPPEGSKKKGPLQKDTKSWPGPMKDGPPGSVSGNAAG